MTESSENDIRRCAVLVWSILNRYKQWQVRNKENFNTQNTLMTNDATRTGRKEKHDNNTKESLFK